MPEWKESHQMDESGSYERIDAIRWMWFYVVFVEWKESSTSSRCPNGSRLLEDELGVSDSG